MLMSENKFCSSSESRFGENRTIAEAVILLLLCFLFGMSMAWVSNSLPSVFPALISPNLSLILFTSSVALGMIFICLIWIKKIKEELLSALGIVNTKSYWYLAAAALGLISHLFTYYLHIHILGFGNIFKQYREIVPPLWRFIESVVIVAIAEELYFRGVLFPALRNKLGPALAVVLSALIVSALSMDPLNFSFKFLASLMVCFLNGLIYALLAHYSNSIMPSVLCHSVFNLMLIISF